MNANGPEKDPSDEDEAEAEILGDGAGASKDDKVPASLTDEKTQSGSHSSPAQAAPAQSKISKQQTEKSGIAAMLQFVSEAMIELRKITWPDRQQVIKETMSVIVLVAIITGCVLAFDFGIAKAVFEPLDKLARQLGGGVGVHH